MKESISCQHCGSELKAGAKFCSKCGQKIVVQLAAKICPNQECSFHAKAEEKFCPQCGTALPQTGVKVPATKEALCVNCDFYRECKPISNSFPNPGHKEVSEALVKVKEEETKQRVSEAKIKTNNLKVNLGTWGLKPMMSNYCAYKQTDDIYEICELKNNNKNCKDFTLKKQVPYRNCVKCTKFGAPDGTPAIDEFLPYEAKTKLREAYHAEHGLEVTMIHHNKGTLQQIPKYHTWCQALSMPGDYKITFYHNRYGDCHYYHSNEPEYLSHAFQDVQAERCEQDENKELDVIRVLSKLIVALRCRDENQLWDVSQNLREDIKRGFVLQGLINDFDDMLFLNAACLNNIERDNCPHAKKFANYINQIYTLFPDKVEMLNDPQKLAQLWIKPNTFIKRRLWSGVMYVYSYFLENFQLANPADLKEIYLQDLREKFYFENLNTPKRARFIEQEKTKIENGFYPSDMTVDLQRTLNELKMENTKMEKQLHEKPEADMIGSIAIFAPLSSSDLTSCAPKFSQGQKSPNPFAYRPLGKDEVELLKQIIYEDIQIHHLAFIQQCLQIIEQILNQYWQWVQSEGMYSDMPFEFTQSGAYSELVQHIEMSHCYVSRLYNYYGRFFNVPDFNESVLRGMCNIITLALPQILEQCDVNLARVLFPKYYGINSLMAQTMKKGSCV